MLRRKIYDCNNQDQTNLKHVPLPEILYLINNVNSKYNYTISLKVGVHF
ncbi:MAG: hypothetical protein HND52_04850 [Ignavibacteriae bacterium]|nr:hypothetical protein [Ignavibacteriota bacterium]